MKITHRFWRFIKREPMALPVPPLLPPPTSFSFKTAAQFASLITAAGFLLSALVQSYIFGSWRLDFLQLATPADVLMSGLNIGFPFILFSFATFIGYTITKLFPRRPMGYICAFTIGGVALSIFIRFRGDVPVLWVYIVVVSFWSGIIWQLNAIGTLLRQQSRSVRWLLPFLVPIILSSIELYLACVEKIEFGYDRGVELRKIDVPGIPRECVADVYWIGERSIVIHCRKGVGFYVISNSDKILLGR